VTEVFTGFGEKGQPAEDVARQVVEAAQAYLAAGVPVGEHLADQLLVPLALAGGGSFVTTALSSHGRTNLEVIEQVLGVGATVVQVNDLAWNVTIGKPATEADLPRNTP
jgi:RNA 3'-terminal phosphate cyclase (ATP)